MKQLILLIVLTAPMYAFDQFHIGLVNHDPCSYIKRIDLSDINGDGTVDFIQYARAAESGSSIYFYQGTKLWEYWKSPEGRKLLPPGTYFDEASRQPAENEIGTIDINRSLLIFKALKSKAMKKVFTRSTSFMADYMENNRMTESMTREYKKWINRRFTDDVQPTPFVHCADACSCVKEQPVFFE